MIQGRRVLAVVPARGGSKGVPLKNLRPVCGVPLVARVAQVIEEVPEIDRAVVSTDHEEIARVAENAGLSAPFRRPEELSGDRIPDHPVLVHALEATEALDGVRYDVVLMLQPTSPLRRPEQVRGVVEKLISEGLDAVWSMSVTDPKGHPLKQFRLADGVLVHYDPRGVEIVARQQLDTVYHKDGAAYAFTRDCLLDERTIMGTRTGALVSDEPMLSIDTPRDFELVEYEMKRRQPRATHQRGDPEGEAERK